MCFSKTKFRSFYVMRIPLAKLNWILLQIPLDSLYKKLYLFIIKYFNFFTLFFSENFKKNYAKVFQNSLFFSLTYILLKNSEKDPVLFLPLAFPFHFFSSNFSMMPKMINRVLEYEFITFFSCVRDFFFSLGRSIDKIKCVMNEKFERKQFCFPFQILSNL